MKKTKGDPNCLICKGIGSIPITEDDVEYEKLVKMYGPQADAYMTVKRCACLQKKRFRSKVGHAIDNADVIERSMLEDYEGKNLFLQATLPDFNAHLRAFLWERPLEYYWRMTTDMDLIDVFLGKNEVWPSVGAFTRDPELMIILLGFQSYKNIALPGVVLEALKARQYNARPTWVINPHDMTFKQDHHLAWSPELEWHLKNEFKEATLRIQRQVIAKKSFGFANTSNGGKVVTDTDGKKGSARFQDLDL